jgi:hypothetical protein
MILLLGLYFSLSVFSIILVGLIVKSKPIRYSSLPKRGCGCKHMGGENMMYASSISITMNPSKSKKESDINWEKEIETKTQEEIDILLDNRLEMNDAVNFAQSLINKDL